MRNDFVFNERSRVAAVKEDIFRWDKVENLFRCLADHTVKMEYSNSGFNADKGIVYINANRLSLYQVEEGEIVDI